MRIKRLGATGFGKPGAALDEKFTDAVAAALQPVVAGVRGTVLRGRRTSLQQNERAGGRVHWALDGDEAKAIALARGLPLGLGIALL